LADFQPKVPENYKNADVVMLGNLHPIVQSSVLDQMETKPKVVVLDTMNFLTCIELLEVIKGRCNNNQ
jgi:hypothetical protein